MSDENDGMTMEGGTTEGGLVIDFGNVEESTFSVLPRGTYQCTVANVTFEHSKNSGNPMWTWELEVSEGEYAGRKLFTHTVFAGDGLPRTKRTLGKVAPALLEKPLNPEEVANNGELIGLRVGARVDIRPYQGEQRNNVKDLLAPTEESGEGFLTA